jgi:hypothetical protein
VARVATIEVPAPPDLQTCPEGAQTQGQAYALVMPSVATDPLRLTNRDGVTLSWAPTELLYRGEDDAGTAHYDYIAGSAPAQVSIDKRQVRYSRLFPNADDVFHIQPEQVKHHTILLERPRAHAVYITNGAEFGVSGLVSGVTLPLGTHELMLSQGFAFRRPVARDMAGATGQGRYEVLEIEGGQQLLTLFPAEWIMDPERVYPINLDPTVSTSTSSLATAYPNQRKEDNFSNGDLLGLYISGSNAYLRFSTDGGATWQTPSTGAQVPGPKSDGSIFIDEDDYVHFAGNNNYLRATVSADRATVTWSSENAFASSGYERAPDVVAHREGTGWKAHVVWSRATTNSNVTYYQRFNITSGGTISADGGVVSLSTLDYLVTNGHTYPSIAVDSSKHLHVTWNAAAAGSGKGIRFKKGTYSAGPTWTWGSEEAVTESYYAAGTNNMGPCVVDDSGRAYTAFMDGASHIRVYRRAAGGGWSDLSFPTDEETNRPTIAVDGSDIYLIYTTNTVVLKYRKHDGSWSAAVTIDGPTPACAYPSARRDTSGSAVHVLYTTGSGPTYDVESYTLPLNQPPSPPTDLALANFDATAGARFTYTHVDQDGNAQTAQQVEISRVDTGAVIIDPGKTSTANQYYDIAAGALTNNIQYRVRVRTWDTSDAEGAWSDYLPFWCSAAPTAAITYPANDGDTVNTATLTAEGTISDPESEGGSAWQWWLLDNADVELWTSGKVASVTVPRMTLGYTLTNGDYKLRLQVWDAKNIASPVVTRTFPVSIVGPAKPALVPIPNHVEATTLLQATNPAPTPPEPTVTQVRYERSLDGGTTVQVLVTLAAGTDCTDYAARYGIAQYRAVAIGENGVETAGDWEETALVFSHWRFIPTDGSNPVLLAYRTRISWRPEQDIRVPQTVGKFRREVRGPSFAKLADISAWFGDRDGLTAQEWRERFLAHMEAGTVGYLKSPFGDVYKGTLSAPAYETHEPSLYEDVRATFRETGVVP